MGYFDGVGDVANMLRADQKGEANGYASLDANGWVPVAQLPSEPVNVRRYGAVGNGIANDTAAIQAAIDAAPAGSTIYIPNGVWLVSTITTTKQLHFKGDDQWTTVLQAVSGHTGAVIEFNLSAVIPPSGVRNYFGSSVTNLGIDMTAASAATGVLVGANSSWVRLSNLSSRGGAISIDNRGANNWLQDLHLFDAARFIVIDGDTGLELTIRDVAMGRNTAGQTVVGIEVTCDSAAGIKGALMMENVRLASGTTGGVSTVCGLKMSAPSPGVSVPLFAKGCIFDNITGSHGSQATCAMELVHVFDVKFNHGWLNAGTFGPAVRITGGGRIWFTENTMFGGPTADPKTYEFVSGSTNGFYSRGNYTPTNVIYHIPAVGYPTNVFTDDVSILSVPSAVTNRPVEFAAGAGIKFGQKLKPERVAGTTVVFVAGTAHTFTTLDQNKMYLSNSVSPTTFTFDVPVPDWEVGAEVRFMRFNTGTLSIAGAGGAAILVIGSASAAAQFSEGKAVYLGGNLWKLVWFD